MAIYKPSWLRSFLEWLDDTWPFSIVHLGSHIEDAFDWALDWINYAIRWAEYAFDKAVDAWYKAVSVGQQAWKDLQKEAGKLWAEIDTWWDDLGDWWSAKYQIVKEWVRALVGSVEDLIDDVKRGLASLSATWDNFWRNTWPQLVKDFNALLVQVGNFFTVILPGLASRLDVIGAINDFALKWKDLFDFWGGFSRSVIAFFLNPLDWLLETFYNWFLGKEK